MQDFALEVDKWREGKPIDGLINNAAMGSGSVIKYVADALDRSAEENHLKVSSYTGYNHTTRSLLHQHALEDEAMMRVNSLGPMWVTEALLPFMATKLGEESPKRSVVLFLGSVGGSEIHKGLFFCTHYTSYGDSALLDYFAFKCLIVVSYTTS